MASGNFLVTFIDTEPPKGYRSEGLQRTVRSRRKRTLDPGIDTVNLREFIQQKGHVLGIL